MSGDAHLARAGAKLFAEFPPVSSAAWRAEVEQDLQGTPLEERLIWETYEGISISPYYRSEDIAGLRFAREIPRDVPGVGGIGGGPNEWTIREEIARGEPKAANEAARRALERGAGSLCFVMEPAPGGTRGVVVRSRADMADLLRGLPLDRTPICFRTGACALPVLALFLTAIDESGANGAQIRGSIDYDPIRDLLATGESQRSAQAVLAEAGAVLRSGAASLPCYQVLCVSAEPYLEAGGHAVQELGFSVAAGVEYLAAATDAGIPVVVAARQMEFRFAAASNYFIEIAKLRAARLLWTQVQEAFMARAGAYGVPAPMKVHVRGARYNKTIYGAHGNVFRGATEAMSAIIGGCDSLTLAPFDECYRAPDEVSLRLARNTQLILKHEAYLARTIDPGGGSYYLEWLTDALARKAWDLLQHVEAEGGLLAAVQAGMVQPMVAEVGEKRRLAVRSGRDGFVGVNLQPDPEERMARQVDDSSAVTALGEVRQSFQPDPADLLGSLRRAFAAGATLADTAAGMAQGSPAIVTQPLRARRGAEAIESHRLAAELEEPK